MLCILIHCILTHPEGLSKYSTTQKKYSAILHTKMSNHMYMSLFQKAQQRRFINYAYLLPRWLR